jgi:hypothetical protein
MKTGLIAKLEQFLEKDPAESAADVRALQKEYQRLKAGEIEKARMEFIHEGGKAREFSEPEKSAEDLRFESLLQQYDKLRREHEKQTAAVQARNLSLREEIIAKIKDLSKVSENVGAAMRKLQELQQEWKQTGPVSPHKYREVQSAYSHALEEIYYNLKIFRDLQEHDLKKNLEHKSELIEKLKSLRSNENIKETEQLIKAYRNEWDEIGPVPHTRWEALKQEYKATLDENYARLKAHYHSLEEQKEKNLEQKQQIIEKIRGITADMKEARPAKWNEASAAVIALQADWKNTGRAPEKQNDRVWTEFRSVCDEFFDKKKAYFAALNEKTEASRKAKSELIAKAESLAESTDWQKTGHELMRLQDEWRKNPGYGDKDEHRLFTRFRKACNSFFEARKAHFDKLDEGYLGNLKQKEELIAQLGQFDQSGIPEDTRGKLNALLETWTNIGPVPAKEKKRVNDLFYNKVDELYDSLHIDKDEKMLIQFRNRIQRLLTSENPFDQLKRESDHLKKLIEETEAKARTFENNLGFFRSAKNDNPIIREIEEKVAAEKAKAAVFARKKKMIGDEMRRLNEVQKEMASSESKSENG